jgi:hypothetical protein
MIRRLFTILSGLSLLLCMATVVLWVRSYERLELLGALGRHHWHGLATERGSIWVFWRLDPLPAPVSTWQYYYLNANGDGSGIPDLAWVAPTVVTTRTGPDGALGFAAYHETLVDQMPLYITNLTPRYAPPERWRIFQFPFWFVAGLTGVLPTFWIARRVRRWRNMAGLCLACGYDLRATPERCPECGAVPPGMKEEDEEDDDGERVRPKQSTGARQGGSTEKNTDAG